MAITYDPAEPTIRDVIRGWLQDIDPVRGILQDATIDARIARFGPQEGAAKCAESCASFWAQQVERFKQGSEEFAFARGRQDFYAGLATSGRNNGIESGGYNLRAGAPPTPDPLTDERLMFLT